MFATMLRRDQECNGLRVARASWLVGVSVRDYREIEGGVKPPDADTYLAGGAGSGGQSFPILKKNQ
jgi:hypothetical protein